MTRRERKEARIEKRLDWAAGREAKAAAKFDMVHRLADSIPLGQPILVGHHSERHARKDAERIHNGMAAAVESSKMAEHHRATAVGIQDQLDRSIFSDDTDALDRLAERIAELEFRRERMKASNAAYRKGDGAWSALLGITQDQAAARRVTIEAGYSWCRKPHPAYELSNLGGNIARLKERVKAISASHARTVKAEAGGGVLIEGETWVRVTFAEKPERAILDALRAAGFRWSSGCWVGERAKLPGELTEPAS
jgi:hypothetical protein